MKRFVIVALAVAVVVAMVATVAAWSAPCPCDSTKGGQAVKRSPTAHRAKAVRGGVVRIAARPSALISGTAYAATAPKVATVQPEARPIVVTAQPRRSWWQRNHRWVVPVAVVGAGVVGYHLRGEGEERVVVVRERCRGEGDD